MGAQEGLKKRFLAHFERLWLQSKHVLKTVVNWIMYCNYQKALNCYARQSVAAYEKKEGHLKPDYEEILQDWN